MDDEEMMEEGEEEGGVSPPPHSSAQLPSQCCWCKREGVECQIVTEADQARRTTFEFGAFSPPTLIFSMSHVIPRQSPLNTTL